MAENKIYHVVFDTNATYERDEAHSLIKPSVIKFIKDFSSKDGVELSYYLPDVVRGEIIYRILSKIQSAKDSSNNNRDLLNRYCNSSLNEIIISSEKIKTLIDKELSVAGFSIIDTPFQEIDFAKIIEKAIFHDLPFQNGDKGFKDSIIAETILSHLKKMDKKINIVIICNDILLNKYLSHQFDRNSNVNIYSSIPEFENELSLRLFRDDNKFIENITGQAQSEFILKNEESLYIKDDVQEQIIRKFRQHIESPNISGIGSFGANLSVSIGGLHNEAWIPKGPGEFKPVNSPTFIKNGEDNKLYWENTIVYSQNYISSDKSRTANYQADFNVEWTCELSPSGALFHSKIIDIKYLTSRSSINWNAQSNISSGGWGGSGSMGSGGWGGGSGISESISSGASIAGQGTISVSPTLTKHYFGAISAEDDRGN